MNADNGSRDKLNKTFNGRESLKTLVQSTLLKSLSLADPEKQTNTELNLPCHEPLLTELLKPAKLKSPPPPGIEILIRNNCPLIADLHVVVI